MASALNPLHDQVVKQFFDSKPANYIAMIIRVPESIVRMRVSEISIITGRKSFEEIKELKKKRKAQKVANVRRSEVEGNEIRGRGSQQAKSKQLKKVEKCFETKIIDYSKMITVRIDAKTCIQIPFGADPIEAKRKYLNLRK